LKILFFSSFDENFDKIRKLYNTIYEKISTLKTIINRIPSFYDYDFKDIDKSLKEIKSINKNIEKVKISQGIDKYLINLYKLTDKTNQNKRRSYEDEEEDENRKEEKDERQEIYAIQEEIRKKYGNNNFFNNNIKQLTKILKQNESISNKSLQKEIKTQLENLSSLTPFFEKIDKLNIFSGDYDFLYTGLSKNINKNEKYLNEDEDEEEDEEDNKKNKAQKEEEEIDSYSIYLFMDLLQGQMNNKNRKEIDCEYRNESLGKTFLNLTSNVFKNKYLIENYTYPYLSLGGLQEETKKKLNSLQKTQKVKNKKPKKQTTQKQQPKI